jgi:hypothetical protein
MRGLTALLLTTLMAACASTPPAALTPARSDTAKSPSWLTKLEANAVVIESEFEGDAYDAPAQSGSGLIVGVTESDVAILTVAHLLVAPQNTLKRATLHFVSTTGRVDVPAGSRIEHLRDETVLLVTHVGSETALQLKQTVSPIKLAGPSEVAHGGEPAWYTGRCGAQSIRSFALQELHRSADANADILVSGHKLPPGCSGGGIFLGGRLIGLMQRTDTTSGHASEVQTVLRQLRELHPHDTASRNLLEQFATISFARVPYQSTYQLNDATQRLPLTPTVMLPVGRSLLQVHSGDSEEVASSKLLVEPEQSLDCRVQFATSTSRFRSRYRYYLMGGSLAVLVAGGVFAGVAEQAYDDFQTDWSRDARDRNQLFSSMSLYTLIAGAALLTSSAVFAWTGDTYERSTVPCK